MGYLIICTFQKIINISVGWFRFFYMVTTLIGVNFSTFGVKLITNKNALTCLNFLQDPMKSWLVTSCNNRLQLSKRKDSTKLFDGVLFLSMKLVYYAKMNCSCSC